MKKLILIICIIILSLIFVATKNQNENIKTNSVNFCSWGSQSEVKIISELINDFEKETNIKVNFIHIPQNYFQKLHLLFASNYKLDVIFLNNQYAKTYISANLLKDLSNYFNQNEYYDVSINAFKENAKIYAIPRDISNLVLYVNKDIMKKRGIKYQNKIKTLTELKEIAKQLTFKDTYGINSEENSLFWLYYLAANGGGILSDDGKEIILNKKESLDAINFYSDLINKENIAPTKAQIGSMTTAQMFINGKLSMYLGGRWLVPKFKETITFNWDIIEFPSNEKNKVYIDASGWAIAENSNNIENSIKLIQYLSSSKSIEKFTQSGLIIPARIDVANKYIEKENQNKPQHSKIFIDMLKNAKPTPVNKNYNKINDIINEEIQNVLSGQESASEAFNNKVIKKIEGLL